jgi:hypothetical protein
MLGVRVYSSPLLFPPPKTPNHAPLSNKISLDRLLHFRHRLSLHWCAPYALLQPAQPPFPLLPGPLYTSWSCILGPFLLSFLKKLLSGQNDRVTSFRRCPSDRAQRSQAAYGGDGTIGW